MICCRGVFTLLIYICLAGLVNSFAAKRWPTVSIVHAKTGVELFIFRMWTCEIWNVSNLFSSENVKHTVYKACYSFPKIKNSWIQWVNCTGYFQLSFSFTFQALFWIIALFCVDAVTTNLWPIHSTAFLICIIHQIWYHLKTMMVVNGHW